MNGVKRIKAFKAGDLMQYLHKRTEEMADRIEKEDEDYILNVSETRYLDYLESAYRMSRIHIDFEAVTLKSYEVMIWTRNYGVFFDLDGGGNRQIPRPAFAYVFPCTGNLELFNYKPSSWLVWTPELDVSPTAISLEIVDIHGNAQGVANEGRASTENLKKQVEYINIDIDNYNSSIRATASQAFNRRKERILHRNEMVAALGVPVHHEEKLPRTYSIPTPQFQKSITVSRPEATRTGFTPEPTLDEDTYKEILQTIHDLGKVFERLPATYSGRSEEALRDSFLLYLEPRFPSSATGETFNREGKTDILIRHQNSNAFIAECKFWKGRKQYLGTIDQLLGYLTWRDSKAAIVLFVENQDISTVLRTIEESTPTHPNYLGYVGKQDDAWLNYKLHIKGDPNREVRLAVLAVHIPPSTNKRISAKQPPM
jgi:hypothetical protein